MRTTLTLDPGVARLLEEEVHRQRKPFKQVVNEAIRRGLMPATRNRGPGRCRVRPHKTTLRPGIDAHVFDRLADELEEEAVEKMRGRR
jgi:hypothetical protein